MFRKIATTATALALVAGVMLTSQSTTAEAGNGWRVGAGIAGGLAAGAITGAALAQRRDAAPRYYAPPPAYYPAPAPVVTYRAAPWSPAWFNYCRAK